MKLKYLNLKYCVLFYCFFIFALLPSFLFASNKDNQIVGISYTNSGLAVVLENKPDSYKVATQEFFSLWAAVSLPDDMFYSDLRPDRSCFYQVPIGLWFIKWGSVLVKADLSLKRELRNIITNISDPQISQFWHNYLNAKKPSSIDMRLVVVPDFSEVIRLKDGLLVKDLALKVKVQGKDKNYNDELANILSQRLTVKVNQSPEFAELRKCAKVLLLAQCLKEQVILENKKFPFKSEINKKHLLSVTKDSTFVILRGIRSLIKLYATPVRLMFNGYSLRINGAIDFTGMMSNCDVKDVPLTVSEAVDRLGRFYIVNLRKLVVGNKRVDMLLRSYIEQKESVPFWKKFLPSYRKQIEALKWAYALLSKHVSLHSQGIKLGSKVSVKQLKIALYDLCKISGQDYAWIQFLPSSGEVVFISRFTPATLPKNKVKRLRQSLGSNILPFMSQFVKGEIVGLKLNLKTKRFFIALLDNDKKPLTGFISKNIQRYFFEALKEVQNDFKDPFLKAVYSISLIDTYKGFLDASLVSPLPFIEEYVAQVNNIVLDRGLKEKR